MAYCGGPNPDGTLTLNGVSLEPVSGAWHCLDPGVLWQRGQKRGTGRQVPFATDISTGEVSYPRYYKATQRVVHLGVHGNVNVDGARQVDWIAGAELNLEYLNSHICDPDAAGVNSDGTISASLLMPSGAIRTGFVTVENEIVVQSVLDAADELGANDYLMICAITATVAAGALA